jgi:hypothetical protein
MELRRKLEFIAQTLYPNDSIELSCDRLKDQMKVYFTESYSDINGLMKFIQKIWSDSKKNNFNARSKKKIISFFNNPDIQKSLQINLNEDELDRIFFVYSLDYLRDLFDKIPNQEIDTCKYRFVKDYNDYSSHRKIDINDLFEYKKTYFY